MMEVEAENCRYSKSAGVPGVATPKIGARLPPLLNSTSSPQSRQGVPSLPLRDIFSAPAANAHLSLQLPPASRGAPLDPLRHSMPEHSVSTPLGVPAPMTPMTPMTPGMAPMTPMTPLASFQPQTPLGAPPDRQLSLQDPRLLQQQQEYQPLAAPREPMRASSLAPPGKS